MKAFHESSSYCFVIVGVWLDENRLIQLNGDLAGRVLAIDADSWSAEELRLVISKGGKLLNVNFDPQFTNKLLASCFDSVWIIQECCYRVCDSAGIYNSDHLLVRVGANKDASEIAQQVVNTQSARYHGFLSGFAEGFMETSLEMYRWLLLPLLLTEPTELEQGLTYADLRRTIDRFHPSRPVNPGSLNPSLKVDSVASSEIEPKTPRH